MKVAVLIERTSAGTTSEALFELTSTIGTVFKSPLNSIALPRVKFEEK